MVRRHLEQSRSDFTSRLPDETEKGNIKIFYVLIKSKRKDQMSRIPLLKQGTKSLTQPKEKAEALSLQYKSVFTSEPLGEIKPVNFPAAIAIAAIAIAIAAYRVHRTRSDRAD